MAYDLQDKLVVAVSARALFDLSVENRIYEAEGAEAYCAYQIQHEGEILEPGAGFSFIQKLLRFSRRVREAGRQSPVEVILMSRSSADASLRFFRSIAYYEMDITRAVFTDGASVASYLKSFQVDLFLSAHAEDVQSAVESGIASGIVCEAGSGRRQTEDETIRIALDGDAVLFTDESERIFQERGLAVFEEHERINAAKPLKPGPFAGFLKKAAELLAGDMQAGIPSGIRTALVTSRCAPAHERVIRTLREWEIRMDEVFFLGGLSKKEVLRAFAADIFFDDQQLHIAPASEVVPSALVPCQKNGKKLEKTQKAGKSHEIRKYSARKLSGKTEPVYSLCGNEW